ncbi:hypothetical protein JOF48_000927 [Arthrobacter stackebrandtii]|uniref:Alpha/beta hydrolase n=1 Tax=Arthrobacter stackebrandtii TaxID=272161 RepID=A0ABS4YTK0_9MICC|nr:alpha/beta hydrolase [Arthrobacter stackebrandtii]MBP2412128.1 hypothetical protein [Arthrobacter stackebrandtii]
MKMLKRLGWWSLDYLYAGWRQLESVFRRGAPAHYAQGDPALPAVVLLPGVYESWFFLDPAAARLSALGYRVFTVPALGFNRLPVPDSAALATARLAALHAGHGVTRCILLAHSKGGLIGKHLMLDADRAKGVRLHRTDLTRDGGSPLPAPAAGVEVLGMVAVATPFAGSPYARYLMSRTMRDFSPADGALLALQEQAALNHKVVSIYPEFDPHIPGGSALAGAANIELPVSGHFRTLSDETVLAAVGHAVAQLAAEA